MNVLQMGVSAGILILMVVIIRAFAINRLPKTMFIVLWEIALCRLLIPFSIPSKFGIANVISRIGETFALKAAAEGNWNTGTLIYRNSGYMEAVYKPLQLEPVKILWIVGAALLALFFSASFYKSYREIRTALPIKGNALIDQWLSEQKIYRSIRILVSDKVTTPLTYGIIKPKIVLPKSMDCSDELQMRYILTHELIHIKQFDALWKLVLVIALCCHWFNPMVWVLYVLMNRDLEIACDEKVIKLFGEDMKSSYALSLIEMAERSSKFTPLYTSFSKNATEERILSIMKFKKTSVLSVVLALVLVAGASSVFAESAAKVLRLHGVIQTSSGKYSFDVDEKGVITVKDAEGKRVSTTSIGSDGKATLTDGDGKAIKTVQLYFPDYKQADGKLFKIYGALEQPGDGEVNVNYGIFKYDGMLPKFTAEVSEKDIVTVKDAEGKMVAAGTADNNGIAILTDSTGADVGTATVNNGTVAKLTLSIIGSKQQ